MRQSLVAIPDLGGQTATLPTHDLLQLADVLRLLSFIGRHKKKLIASLLTAVAVAAAYLDVCPRVYESDAKLLVVRKDPLIVQGMPSAMLHGADAMTTHISTIKSEWIASRALADPRLDGLETFVDKVDPVSSLIASLQVSHQDSKAIPYSNSNILEFSFKGSQPQECKIVLDAVIDAYRQYLNDSSRTANQDASALIAGKAKEISISLQNKENEYKAFRKAAPKPMTSRRLNFYQQRLANLDSKRVDLGVRRAEASSLLSAWRQAARTDADPNAVPALLPENLKSNADRELEKALLPLLAKEREARVTLRLGDRHPKVRAIREEIAMTRSLYSGLILPELEQSPGGDLMVRPTESDPIAEYTLQLEQELEAIVAAEESLRHEIEQEENRMARELELERDEARALAEFELKSEQHRNAIARDQQLYDALMNQLQRVEIDIVTGAYSTTLIDPPGEPRVASPRTLLVYALSVFLGIAVGFAGAFTMEISNQLRSDAKDAAQKLSAPVLGQIPAVSPKGAALQHKIATHALDPMLCTHRLPDSSVAEAYRCLRTSLIFKAESERLKIFVVTGLIEGNGASTLAANLAVSFAQSGRKVLLIDANLRSPRIHQVFGIANDKGLATVLTDTIALDDAIVDSEIKGLSILPCGPPPSSRPTDLLSSLNLKEMIGVVRERFDYVLIDAPGMFAVADAQILAANSDGVLLTIRGGQNGVPDFAHTEEMVKQSGVNLLGVVLTDGVPQDPIELDDRADFPNWVAGQVTSASN